MKVTIALEESVLVEVECEGGYAPDVMSDLAARARELFADVMSDAAAHQAQQSED